jgi:serine phosphatase RsbU (regulator of sigma subunit)
MENIDELLEKDTLQALVDKLNEEAWSIRTFDSVTALKRSEEAEALALECDHARGLARSKRNIGFFSFKVAQYERALTYSCAALKLFRDLRDPAGEADCLYNLGITHLHLGDNSIALEQFLDCFELRQQIGDSAGESDALNNIGHVYLKFSDRETALEYYERALAIARRIGNKAGEGYALMNIATIYLLQKIFDKALEYSQLSLEARKAANDHHGVFVSMHRIASVYGEIGRYEESIAMFNHVIVEATKVNERMGLAYCNNHVGKIYLKLRRFEDAEQSFTKAMTIATELNAKELTSDVSLSLSELYEAKGEISKALEYHKEYHNMRQEAWKMDSDRILNNARTVHKAETAEKEAEIHRLKNVELAEALQMINDSISYAQRIQKAILPDERLINEIIPDAFVLYNPRNVVSGDFYWLSGDADRYQFAVADCTGHGVPGAFMSLICSSLLSQISSEMSNASPSEILLELDKKVCDALKQHDAGTRTQDGMDIALCMVDRSAKKLWFASANRSLVIIRKGEMIQLKGDKYPVGGTQLADKSFTCHTVDIEPGDILYMFTDGYADQFGGKNNKKFSSRQLLQLIMNAHSSPFNRQQELFTETFNTWKGDHEQIDDVTLVAFKP